MSLKTFVTKSAEESLRQCGFIASGMIWNRHVNDLVHVIEFQENRWNTKAERDFGISIGVAFPAVWEIVWGKTAPRVFSISECFPQVPFGFLPSVNIGRNVGWTYVVDEENSHVEEEVHNALASHCVPFLNKCLSLQSVLAMSRELSLPLQPYEQICKAVMCFLSSRQQEGQQILDGVSSNPHLRAWSKRVDTVMDGLRKAGLT